MPGPDDIEVSAPEIVRGWGGTAPSAGRLLPIDTTDAARDVVARAGPRGAIARGLGRSYGDAAQNAGGVVLDLRRLDRVLSFDPATGVVVVEGGASLDDLIARLLPRGWFVPVTPGTRAVTVGGAIAADIHGKNHHVAGSFGQHVLSMDVLLGDGTIAALSPVDEPEWFWATVGGMGLTGIVLRATLQLVPVPTSYLAVDTERAVDLDDLMTRQIALEERHPYTVAWIDCLATGARLGRGVISAGHFAEPEQLTPVQALHPRGYRPHQPFSAPRWAPNGLLNRWTVAAFNEAWFRRAPESRVAEIQSVGAFFHPLDGINGWNRLYGSQGFVQYQFVVPHSATNLVQLAIEKLSALGAASFLAVLKRFGAGNEAPLSFPTAGWTLALDIPTGVDGLRQALDELDEHVAGAGGRIYLAKDSRMHPRHLSEMYPRLDEWREIRSSMDPLNTFTSDQARRLHL